MLTDSLLEWLAWSHTNGLHRIPSLRVSEQGRSLAGRVGKLRLFGDLRKRGIPTKSLSTASEKQWWILGLASYPQEALQSPIWDPLWKLPAEQICVLNCHSCCIRVNDPAPPDEASLTLWSRITLLWDCLWSQGEDRLWGEILCFSGKL